MLRHSQRRVTEESVTDVLTLCGHLSAPANHGEREQQNK
jgi:hypothetical protein